MISPSSVGLCQLLCECEKFGLSHDVKYNAKKSEVMIFRSVTLKECSVCFKLKRVTLHVVATYKYFGNYISDDLSDDDGINRQYGTLYVQRNNYNAKI